MGSKLKLNRHRRTYAEKFVLDSRMPNKAPGWCGSRRRALNALRFQGITQLRPFEKLKKYDAGLLASAKDRWASEGLTQRG